MAGKDTSQPDADGPGATGRPDRKPKRPSRARRRPSEGPEWFGSLSQLDFEIDFFERVLARRPDSVDVLRILAELVSRKGAVTRAVELDRRLATLLPEDFLAFYNLGCSLARAGHADEAIDSLSRAILLGYDDLAHMETDPDLESLHDHPDFQALLGAD